MPPTLIFVLLILALLLPVIGAVALRLLGDRMTAGQFYGAAATVFCVAVASVLVLSQSSISNVRVGNLTVVLPVTGPDVSSVDLPPLEQAVPETLPTEEALPAATATEATMPSATALPTTAPPTRAPTNPPTATATPEPTATSEPTATPPAPEPTAPPAPAEPRTYTVQPGDTLRGIAEQFDVSVEALLEANNLTPEEADALRIGQELIIPQ